MNHCQQYEPQPASESYDAFRTDTCDMWLCSAVGTAQQRFVWFVSDARYR